MIKSYRDLIVWQKAMELVKFIYVVTNSYPSSERYGLSDQTRRSTVSVPSNIAEGYGRGHTNDYTRFLQIARGSLFEMETQAEIAFSLKYMSEKDYTKVVNESHEIEKMLNSLIKKLSAKK